MDRGMLRVSGPLAPLAAGYERWLVAQGFRSGAVADRLSQFACLSRWLDAEGLLVAELGPERVEEFLAARRATGSGRVASVSLRLPLEYLSEIGVVAALAAPSAAGPVGQLVADYRRHLILERGWR